MATPKKTKLHKFEIKQKKEAKGQISTGARTELWMDGKKMKGVTRVTLDVKAAAVTKINIELIGEFNAHVLGDYYLNEGTKGNVPAPEESV